MVSTLSQPMAWSKAPQKLQFDSAQFTDDGDPVPWQPVRPLSKKSQGTDLRKERSQETLRNVFTRA
jgi:hypothetical protein